MDRIIDIPRMQEFKRRLAALLSEFDATLSSGYSGDTHGIEDEWLTITVGDDYTELDSELSGHSLEQTIGTEVLYVPPVKPTYVDPYTVFPVGTRVKYQISYLRTLHRGWMRRAMLRGVVVPRSGSGLNSLNQNYVYVEWTGDTLRGHKVHEIEEATP